MLNSYVRGMRRQLHRSGLEYGDDELPTRAENRVYGTITLVVLIVMIAVPLLFDLSFLGVGGR